MTEQILEISTDQPQKNLGGRPRKDIPIKGIKVNEYIHRVAAQKIKTLSEATKQNLSFVKYGTTLISQFVDASDVRLLSLSPKIQTWGEPWKFIYVEKTAYHELIVLAKRLNLLLPEQKQEKLWQGVNCSNLLSAIILIDCNKR